ncbi:MAG: hypothetical protein Q9223_005167 [Gallowayella weberi]
MPTQQSRDRPAPKHPLPLVSDQSTPSGPSGESRLTTFPPTLSPPDAFQPPPNRSEDGSKLATGHAISPQPPTSSNQSRPIYSSTGQSRIPRIPVTPPILPPHAAVWPSDAVLSRFGMRPGPNQATITHPDAIPSSSNQNTQLELQTRPQLPARAPQRQDPAVIQPVQPPPTGFDYPASLQQHATPAPLAGRPISMIPWGMLLNRTSSPLPNASAANFPFRGSYGGMLIALDRPFWDSEKITPPSGDMSYRTPEERLARRQLKQLARSDVWRYGAPDWLVESESEDESG